MTMTTSMMKGTTALLSLWLVPAAALAQSATAAGSAPAAEAQAGGIEDIVVTAERRSESVQRTPIAISAFSGDTLTERRIDRVEDLSQITPSLQIFAEQVNNEAYIIRGIGRSNEDLTTDAGVAVYINDIYISQPGMANAAFFDVERVEVLRGPQGTLYGKNAVGGVINVISRRPTRDYEGELIAEVGGLDLLKVTGAAGGPLGDTLSGRIAFYSSRKDGAYTNLTTGRRANDIETQAIRGSLNYAPSDRVNIDLIVDYSDSNQDGVLKSVIADRPGERYILKDFFIVDEFPTQEADIRSARSDLDGEQGIEQWGAAFRADFNADAGTISFLSGYRTEDSYNSEDVDRTAQAANNFYATQHSWMTSQELRFVSDDGGPLSLGGRLHWSVGAYWFHEEGRRDQYNYLNARIVTSSPGDPDNPDDGLLGPGTPDAQNSTARFLQTINTDSFALFGQAKYDITDRLGLTLGLRYTQEQKRARLQASSTAAIAGEDPYSLFVSDGPFDTTRSRRYRKLTPKAVLEYRFSPLINFYASYSRGFKSGGFNGQAGTLADFAPFEPEVADNYELGIKADLLDRRLRVNLAAFHVDFKDLQVAGTNEQGQVITSNASNARVQGIELEITAQPVDGLTLRGSMSLLDATFQDYIVEEFDPTITDGPPFVLVDKSGDRLDDVPNHMFNLGADYRFELPGGSRIRLGVDASIVSDTVSNQNTLRANAYQVVNALVGWTSADGHWDVSGWIKNLTDEVYYRGGGAVPDFNKQLTRVGLVADPRTAGVTVKFSFGAR